MAALGHGLLYFVMVFAAGFALAPLREFVLVPAIGPMWGELVEMPVMALVIWFAAGRVSRRIQGRARARTCLVAGGFALSLMVLAEIGVVIWVRGATLAEYVAGREPVSGVVYLMVLAGFGLMPWLRRGAGRG